MSRSLALASLISLGLLVAGPAHADRIGKGHTLIFIGLGGHTGEFAGPGPFRFETGEIGGQLAYNRFLTDHWTMAISGSYHASQSTTDDNNPNGTPFTTEKLATHSLTLRVGGDRFAFIDDNVALYAGPGVFVTRGRMKEEQTVHPPAGGGNSSREGPNTTEVGLNGRLGMYARLKQGVALFGHIGQLLSRASAKDASGRVSWWTSTHEGAVGLAFDF